MVQGRLTTGVLNALVATDVPGPGTVLKNQNWQFTAPVFIDDTVTVEVEVLKSHETKPVTKLMIAITGQTGEKYWRGRRGATPSHREIDLK